MNSSPGYTAIGSSDSFSTSAFDTKRTWFLPGELAATVPVQVRGDDVSEEAETITVTLTQCCEPAVPAGPLTATVTIRHDDAAEPPPPSRRRSVRH